MSLGCSPDEDHEAWIQKPKAIVDDFSSISLSPAGTHLAANFMLRGMPNKISIVNLSNKEVHVLSGPKEQYLTDISFCPDGNRLIFISTPPNYLGTSLIHSYDIQTKALGTFGAKDRLYRAPSFAPDGRRIACFRDMELPGSSYEDIRNRTVSSYGLHEIDVSTGEEKLLDQTCFGGASRTAYGPLGDGIYFSAHHPLVPLADNPGIHVRSAWLPDYEEAHAYPRAFFLLFGTPLGERPTPLVSKDVGFFSSFFGVSSSNEVIIRSNVDNQRISALILLNGKTRETYDGVEVSGCAISYDSKTVAISYFVALNDGAYRKRIRIIDRAGSILMDASIDDLKHSPSNESALKI